MEIIEKCVSVVSNWALLSLVFLIFSGIDMICADDWTLELSLLVITDQTCGFF